jgi:hypothetical protein
MHYGTILHPHEVSGPMRGKAGIKPWNPEIKHIKHRKERLRRTLPFHDRASLLSK